MMPVIFSLMVALSCLIYGDSALASPAVAQEKIFDYPGHHIALRKGNEIDGTSFLDIDEGDGIKVHITASDASGIQPILEKKALSRAAFALATSAIDEFIRENRVKFESGLLKRLGKERAEALLYQSFEQYRWVSFFETLRERPQQIREAVQLSSLPEPMPRDMITAVRSPIKEHALLVAHSSTDFDRSRISADGLNTLIDEFAAAGRPRIYLLHDDGMNDATYMQRDRQPTFAISSDGGEHHLSFKASEITIAGGFFEECLFRTIKDVVHGHFQLNNNAFTIHFPLAAIYAYPAPKKKTHGKLVSVQTLQEFLKESGSEEFRRHIRETFLLAPTANSEDKPFDPKTYTFEVFIDGIKQTSFGHGKKKVILDFMSAL